jgi:hypothetical protein
VEELVTVPPAAERSSTPTRAQRIALAVAAGVGIVLRWWDLGGPMATFDETYTSANAHVPFGEIADTVRRVDAHPPLDYMLRHWFGSSGDTLALRVPSAVFATATLLVVLAWMWRRGWFGVAVVALTAVSSFELLYGRTARMYALIVLCGTVVAVATDHWVRDDRPRWRWLMVAALVVGLFCHSSVFLLAGALVLVPGRRTDGEAWRWRASIAGAVALWGLVWGAAFAYQLHRQASFWIPFATVGSTLDALNGLTTMYPSLRGLVFVAVVIGAGLLWSEHRTLARTWLLLFAVPFAVAVVIGVKFHFLLPRTLAFAAWAPPVALAAIVERTRRVSTPVALAGAMLVAILVVPSIVPAITFEETSVVPRRALLAEVRPGDAVAVHPTWFWPMISWDLRVAPADSVPAGLADLDASVVVVGDAPFGGRVWTLEPDTYSMATGALVPCPGIEPRHLEDFVLACYEVPSPS